MKKVILILVLVSLIAGSISFFYLKQLLAPANSSDQTMKLFVITKGQSFASIAENLAKEGLIRSPLSLKFASYQGQKGRTIQAGSFKLSPSMTPVKILENLSHGKLDIWVTILEGWRREEVADNLETNLTAAGIPFDKSKFLSLSKDKEGYLFPDTYLFPLTINESAIVSILETTLTKKISGKIDEGIKDSGRTLNQILTMASIIEREARTSESRKMVSGILWNRIGQGMPLQADATLQYVKGYDKVQKDWWPTPLAIDKDLKSPYNTYQNAGLPPGPICAPSLSSIEAAVFPTASDYWYYITDNNGNMHYAKTLAEHNQNVEKYLR